MLLIGKFRYSIIYEGTYGESSKGLDPSAGLDGEKDEAWLQIHKMHMRFVFDVSS